MRNMMWQECLTGCCLKKKQKTKTWIVSVILTHFIKKRNGKGKKSNTFWTTVGTNLGDIVSLHSMQTHEQKKH